jgi:hypothetical protein
MVKTSSVITTGGDKLIKKDAQTFPSNNYFQYEVLIPSKRRDELDNT